MGDQAKPQWSISTTVHKGRYNLFDLTGPQPYHVGTLVSGSAKHKERFERDAHLIASAPDLLAFAEVHNAYMLAAGYEGPESAALHPAAAENWRRCRSAISRAKGEQ